MVLPCLIWKIPYKLFLNGESPIEFKELGRWLGTDPVTHNQTEIDIMGEQDKISALFCECKWTNEKADLLKAV